MNIILTELYPLNRGKPARARKRDGKKPVHEFHRKPLPAGFLFGDDCHVVGFSHSAKGFRIIDCICGCGKDFQTRENTIKNGGVKSCGCATSKAWKKVLESNKKHGHSGDGLGAYKSWLSMNSRCNYPAHKSYDRYGQAGIKICERWKDFSLFYQDMGDRPNGTSLDRIDNSKGYEPGNCRWATVYEQAKNRRSSRFIEYQGETKTLIEWAKDPRCPVNYIAFQKRMQSGWSIEHAMTLPLRCRRPSEVPGLYKTDDERDGCKVWRAV